MFKKFVFVAGVAAMMAPVAVNAQDGDNGSIQIKLLGTAVLPDGQITAVNEDLVGLPATSQTKADDNIVPTLAAEYFVSDNFSLETIVGLTSHDVTGDGALAGAELIDGLTILPATITAKFHLNTNSGFKPYLGAGVTHFFIFGEDVGTDAADIGATSVDLSDEFGFVLQGGVDFKLNDNGLGLSVDAKRYFVGTTATFQAGNVSALQTEHDLNPWVISAGLSYRF
ncbi:MAG: OmpW family protein [Sphingomonadales bacterium]|nr:OmpW family protein [Sphingomonadales bacterium]